VPLIFNALDRCCVDVRLKSQVLVEMNVQIFDRVGTIYGDCRGDIGVAVVK